MPRPVAARLEIATLLLATACTTASAETLTGQVGGISDGDTLTVLDASRAQHRIRLDGIDAPEASQAFGQRSRQSLAELAHRQDTVADCPKVDKYQRRVCVVRVQGVDVGLEQIKRGLAWRSIPRFAALMFTHRLVERHPRHTRWSVERRNYAKSLKAPHVRRQRERLGGEIVNCA